jgi:uncharacterized protein GlcG (DUF336 family)
MDVHQVTISVAIMDSAGKLILEVRAVHAQIREARIAIDRVRVHQTA